MPICPNCSFCQIVKNGKIHNCKQRFKYHNCHRQFVENPQKNIISQEARQLKQRISRLVRKTLSFSQ